MPIPEHLFEELNSLFANANNIVVLTGAGISTESGIPDFRSPGGIWSQFRIIEYSEFMQSEEARLEDWRRRFFMENQIGEVKPNVGHQTLTKWVQQKKCSTIITQNIDGLHQEAGTPNEAVIEIHGNARHAICTQCNLRHEISECRNMLETTKQSPRCRSCDGIVKSAVVMFGQAMPEQKTQNAFLEVEQADLFFAIGTSLQVFPAANLPAHAKRSGAKLVIVNRDQTQLDNLADLVIHEQIGQTLAPFLGV